MGKAPQVQEIAGGLALLLVRLALLSEKLHAVGARRSEQRRHRRQAIAPGSTSLLDKLFEAVRVADSIDVPDVWPMNSEAKRRRRDDHLHIHTQTSASNKKISERIQRHNFLTSLHQTSSTF